jgi:hypothetical protein
MEKIKLPVLENLTVPITVITVEQKAPFTVSKEICEVGSNKLVITYENKEIHIDLEDLLNSVTAMVE